MIAIPSVPRISTPTPNCAMRPMTLAPVMLSVVWIARRTSVISRTVVWFVGSQFVPNQLCESAAMYPTDPVSTAATVTSSAIP